MCILVVVPNVVYLYIMVLRADARMQMVAKSRRKNADGC